MRFVWIAIILEFFAHHVARDREPETADDNERIINQEEPDQNETNGVRIFGNI